MTVEDFIAKWQGTPGGAEKKNFAIFIGQLCDLLGVEPPTEPAAGGILGAYEYEAPVPKGSFRSIDASGAVDLYKRGCFIMEAKQSYLKPEQVGLDLGEDSGPRAPSGARYDKLMRDARNQAENYAKNLPATEPVAPFLIVCDIGRAFELYHDAAGNGRGYTFFPDKQRYRIALADLVSDAKVKGTDHTPLELLRAIWTNPRSVDPRFQSADVTRTVASRLASVSKYIEEGIRVRGGNLSPREKSEEVEEAALFLMRILFCMFAEDIGLLPNDKFKEFLRQSESNDQLFASGLADLWQKMGAPNIAPRFSLALASEVRYFNGGLFSETARTYPLGGFVIHDLYEAARQNWRKVEPAIFGTLLEQALSTEERAKLGAHYTPRPYVETLVRATIMDMLEPEWAKVEEAIAALQEPSPFKGEGRLAEGERGEGSGAAPSPTRHPRESGGPASSSEEQRDSRFRGNDEALSLAQTFHARLASIRVLDPACGTGNFLYVAMELMQALEARVIETIQTLGGDAEPKVGPHQFHGLEKNPRAARIAELVLWIGWLRNRLHDDPDSVPQPVLAESASINFGQERGFHGGYDAVLRMNTLGQPDLEHPTIPDWPEAEFIVGNPPFIGGKDLRDRLGSDYAEALWRANPRVPKSADFVMQWWDRAAHTLVAEDTPLIRFGFVTTNSITQEFSRRVIANYLTPLPSGEGRLAEGERGEGSGPTAHTNKTLGRHPRESGGPASSSKDQRDSRFRRNDEEGFDGEGSDAPSSSFPSRGGDRRVGANYLNSSPLVGEDQGGGPAASAAEKTRNERAGDSPAPPTRRAPTQPSPQGGGLSLVMAIPDHPWTKASKDSAAVRIAMTVAERGAHEGELREVVVEEKLDSDEPKIKLTATQATIHPNLTSGADVGSVMPLKANGGIASPGVKLHGSGFIVTSDKTRDLGIGTRDGLDRYIKPYVNGRDLLQHSRDAMVIDLFGLAEQDVRQRFPEVYQHLLSHVWDYQEWNKKEKCWDPAGRKYNRRTNYVEEWWIFGEPRRELRPALAGLPRYIATVETSKHRIFQFLDAEILPDNMIVAIGSDDAFHLGVVQSKIHLEWTLRTGGWLGFGNDNRYSKSKVFDPFPFPDPTPAQRAAIADLAEELDATRKAALAETDRLTMTELYNLREKLRAGAAMDDKQQRRATKARAAIVDRLHEQLDAAVADAYGWGEDWRAGTLAPSEIVARLVALNHARAAEEAAGTIRWLRPDYQKPRFTK